MKEVLFISERNSASLKIHTIVLKITFFTKHELQWETWYVFEKKNFSEQGSEFDNGLVLSQDFYLLWQKKIGILLPKLNCSDLLWEKIVLVIEKNFWTSRQKAEDLQMFWDHLNNSFKQWKVRTISGNIMLF